jgi:membrane protein YqaA with SNARE-associated domain
LRQVIQIQDFQKPATREQARINWPRLILFFIVVIAISLGLAYLFQFLMKKFDLPLFSFSLLAYLIVFSTSLLFNLTVLVPVPFAAMIMVAAAQCWNPLIIALFASLGGTIGELSGYYAGYLEKKLAIPDSLLGYKRVKGWIDKYGAWAIAFVALQPVIPFDIGGLIAGIAKMPLYKFLPALFAGKFPKYIIICYSAIGVLNFIHIPFM